MNLKIYILRQFLGSHYGLMLSGGSNSVKELLTMQHFALTRLLDLNYPGYLPKNKLKAEKLHLNDVIEFDTFVEYIINKYI